MGLPNAYMSSTIYANDLTRYCLGGKEKQDGFCESPAPVLRPIGERERMKFLGVFACIGVSTMPERLR